MYYILYYILKYAHVTLLDSGSKKDQNNSLELLEDKVNSQ